MCRPPSGLIYFYFNLYFILIQTLKCLQTQDIVDNVEILFAEVMMQGLRAYRCGNGYTDPISRSVVLVAHLSSFNLEEAYGRIPGAHCV